MSDPLNPDYYKREGLEAIDVIEVFFHDNFHLANAFKYMARAGLKDDADQDLGKAMWYIDRFRNYIKDDK